MLPNFLIIGAQKSGTTSMYHVLRRHPQIFLPTVKEVNFFFNDKIYNRGVDFYEQYFEDASAELTRGEVSPGYICNPESPPRISAAMPHCKLIMCLRNPIERAYSQYWDNRRRLVEHLSFEQTEKRYLLSKWEAGKRGYFSRGMYYDQIQNYLKYFSTDQMLILLFDDLRDNPRQFYYKVFEFLEVNKDQYKYDFKEKYNTGSIYDNSYYLFFFRNYRYNRYLNKYMRRMLCHGKKIAHANPPMMKQTRQTLLKFFRSANQKLTVFLGRDLSIWS